MKGMKEKSMLMLLIVSLILCSFPLTAGGAFNEEIAPAGRAGEIVINSIEIVTPQYNVVNGRYSNGFHRVGINYALGQAIQNVNVTLNVTLPGGGQHPSNVSNEGNKAVGEHLKLMEVDFTAPGLYTMNATVNGSTGTEMVNATGELVGVNFTTTIYFRVDKDLIGFTIDDKYGNGEGNFIVINSGVNNTGNLAVSHTNLSIEIKNHTSQEVETDIRTQQGRQTWQIIEEMIIPGSKEVKFFRWDPSWEGTYDVTITATNESTGSQNDTSFQLIVENITDFHIHSIISAQEQIQDVLFDISVNVNNTGNAPGIADVQLIICEKDNPTSILYTDTLESNIIPFEGGGGRAPVQVVFPDVSIDTIGDYLVKAAIVGGLDLAVERNLTILPPDNLPPVLDADSLALNPDPLTGNVQVGTDIVFSIDYTDQDDDTGNVTISIDDDTYDMVNSSDNWAGTVTFTYTWTTTLGEHSYEFEAMDWVGARGDKVIGVNFTIHPVTQGWLKGRVTDDEGLPVANVSLDVYQAELNETGVPTGGHINETNVVADVNGNYSKLITFDQTKYIITVNETWLSGSNYSRADPVIDNFLMTALSPLTWVNFTLYRKVVTEKTRLMGNVTDSDGGNLSDAMVTLEIFTDELGEMNVTIEGGNESIAVNITTRTWYNMTASTDTNGTYELSDVPHALPSATMTETGSKIYCHNNDGSPEAATPGWWKAVAHKDGYEDNTSTLKFTEFETTVWSPVLNKEIITHSITGKIEPVNGSVSFSGTQVVLYNATSGEFTIEKVVDGSYVVKIKAPAGYKDRDVNVTVNGSDVNLGTIKLDKIKDGSGDTKYTISIGPFLDRDGNGITGVNVSFTYKDELFSQLTKADGVAKFEEFSVETLDADLQITVKYKDYEKIAAYKDIADTYDDLIDLVEDVEKKDNKDYLTTVGTVVIILIIVIVIVGGLVIFFIMRSKQASEDDLDDIREYECPSCGATVISDMDACPECGETFEEEEYKCPECGEPVEMNATDCEGCGAEFEAPESPEEEAEEVEEGEEELPVPEEPESIEDYDVDVEGVTADDELAGVEDLANELENEELEEPEDL